MSVQLSVIIPVYNAAEYIPFAVESILSQKGVTTEIIVVNDGSTDKSMDALDSFKTHLKIFSIPHSGASEARNYGLKRARGKFVMFLDADDFLIDDMICKTCIDIINQEKLDMVLFSYQYLNNKTGKYGDIQLYSKHLEGITDGNQLFYEMIHSGAFPASPCFKVIRRDILLSNQLFFKGKMIAEDVEWFVRLIICINRFGLLNKPAYIYRKFVPDSVTFSMSVEKCRHFLDMIIESLNSIQNVNNHRMKEALYSSMAYEYSILMGNAHNVSVGRNLETDIKKLSWLLKYDLFPRIKYAKWMYKLCGYKMTSSLFGLYIRLFSKSKQ